MEMFGLGIESAARVQTEQVNELCRQKLLGYSESFRELAKSFDGQYAEQEADAMQGMYGQQEADRQSILEERKLRENRRVICDNLNGMAQVMRKVAKEELYFEPLPNKENQLLIRALRDEGVRAEGLCRMPGERGQMALSMTLSVTRRGRRPASEVADILSVLLGRQMRVSAVSPYFVESEKHSFSFLEQPKYIVLTGFARAVRESETMSGDNYAFLESEKGKLTILLSDGTGSGEKANRDSERVLDLMEKMLEAGYGSEEALSLINSALFAREEDGNHPTLDICNIDLYQGSCQFLKVGGAVSFLKRGYEVENIEVGNLPLGIFQNIQVEALPYTVKNGGYIIMMTDGVLDAFGEDAPEEVLAEEIAELAEQNPGELAERLLHLAICRAEGHIYDDMTILVAGIWENSCIT